MSGPFHQRASHKRVRGRSALRSAVAPAIESLEGRQMMSTAQVSFNHIIIDPDPGTLPTTKVFVDVRGNGQLDPVLGFHQDPSIQPPATGLYWYEPDPNAPNGPWLKHKITPDGNVYEDMQAYDINGDGAVDIIAGYNGNMVWFENPAGHGGDPTQPWVMHNIGPGLGHNFELADLDHDGKIDIVTQQAIYFQNTPDNWSIVQGPNYNRAFHGTGVADVLGSGNTDALGLYNGTLDGQSYPIVWFENPLDHGGNPRTDAWIPHIIGPGYVSSGDSVAFTSGDFNGDGRVEIITGQSERDTTAGPPPGGLIEWVPPADPRTQAWTKVTLDGSWTDIHKIDVADINGDGKVDIVAAEQEQSANKRVGIFYNNGNGTFTEQVIGTTGNQNQRVGDIYDNGALDIFGSNHGFYGAAHPIEAWIAQPPANVSPTPAPPSNLVAYTYAPTQIDLSWKDNSTVMAGYHNAMGFAIDRSTDGTHWVQVATVGEGTSLYRDAGLAAGQTYEYRVRATNGAGSSKPSPVVKAATTGNSSNPVEAVITPPGSIPDGTASFNLSVTYRSNAGIDSSTLGTGNLTVTGPGGVPLQVTGYSISPGSGAALVVAYTVAAPNGAWLPADDGAYSVFVNGNQIADADGNYVPAGAGSLTFQLAVAPDTTPPAAALSFTGAVGSDDETESFTIDYTDNIAVSLASIGSGNVSVTAPNGQALSVLGFTVDATADSPSLAVTYTVAAPGGTDFEFDDNGVYTIAQLGQVTDTSGNAVPQDPALGTFTVAIPDTTAPVASGFAASNVGTAGAGNEAISVVFGDNNAISLASLSTSSLVVTAPDGSTLAVAGISLDAAADAPAVAAEYLVAPAGGSWSSEDNGVYSVSIAAGTVADASGNFLPAGPVGTFEVNIAPPPVVPPAPVTIPPPTRAITPTPVVGPKPRTSLGTFGVSGRRNVRLSYRDNNGALDVFTLSAGVGEAFQEDGSDLIDLVINPDSRGAVLTVTGHDRSKPAPLGDVLVNGTLRSFEARSADLSGTLSVRGSLGRVALGTVTGTIAAAGGIGDVRAASVANAMILAGADLGAQGYLGNSDDTSAKASISSITVSDSIRGSVIAAGIAPGPDGLFGTSDDAAADGVSGGLIGVVTARRGVDNASHLIAGAFGRTSIPSRVDPLKDARFTLL